MDLVNLAGVGARTFDDDQDLVAAELRTFSIQNLVAGLIGAPPCYMPFSALYSQHRAGRGFPERTPKRAANVAVLICIVFAAGGLGALAPRAPSTSIPGDPRAASIRLVRTLVSPFAWAAQTFSVVLTAPTPVIWGW